MITDSLWGGKEKVNFEAALTSLVWITSIISIVVTFVISKWQLGHYPDDLWFKLSVIISCGTLSAALIPELVKVFVSSNSRTWPRSSRPPAKAASLNILSGFVAQLRRLLDRHGHHGLDVVAYYNQHLGLSAFMEYSSVFAFGLVAFGMLGMGPWTIAVDSYGP